MQENQEKPQEELEKDLEQNTKTDEIKAEENGMGIKVEKENEKAKIDVNIIVEYGSRIPDVAFEIQTRVKKAVENMTGFKVEEVNVHVQGVNTDIVKKESSKVEENITDKTE